MSKRRITFALGMGLAVVLFVSACGVALEPVAFTAGGPVVLSPTLMGLPMPARQPAAALSAHEVQRYQVAANTSLYTDHPGSCHLMK